MRTAERPHPGRRRSIGSIAPSNATRSATCWRWRSTSTRSSGGRFEYGFDNIRSALRMSQALVERYLAAARTVSRLAVGSPPPAVAGETLPVGHRPAATRPDGRAAVRPARRHTRDAPLSVGGGEISVDEEPVKLVERGPPASGDGVASPYANTSSVTVRVSVAAGPHDVGVTFSGTRPRSWSRCGCRSRIRGAAAAPQRSTGSTNN